MMKHTAALLVTLASLAAPAAAEAQAVVYHNDPASGEAKIVNSLYGEFLKTNPDIKVGTALFDLSNSRVYSIIVRFDGKATCSAAGCHTVILEYGGPTGWVPIFAHKTKTLALSSPTSWPGGGAKMMDLTVNGNEKWIWGSGPSYGVTLEGLGSFIKEGTDAPQAVLDTATTAIDRKSRGFAEAIKKAGPTAFTSAAIDVGIPGSKAWLVLAAQSSGYCGRDGCPAAFVVTDASGAHPAGVTFSVSSDVVMTSTTGGVHDIAMGDQLGYRTFRWTGKEFQLAATTYPSLVTPAP